MKPGRAERYQSADEVIHDLTRLQSNESGDYAVPASPPATPLTTGQRNHSLNKLMIALATLVAAIVLSVLIIRDSDTEFIVTTNDPEIATRIDKSDGILVENLSTRTTYTLHDAPWEPLQSLEGPVNAHGIKYAPSLRHDGLELLWFRPEPSDLYDGNLWSARRNDVESPFENTHQLASSINTVESEQHPCVSHDGLLLMFDRDTPDPRLWYSVRSATSDDFTDASPIAFPEVWMDRNAYAPSMTSDQSLLFFTSNTIPGREGFDSAQLWFAKRIATPKPK